MTGISHDVLNAFKNPIGNHVFLIDEEDVAKYFSDNTAEIYENFDKIFCQKNAKQTLSYVEVYMAPIMAMRITRHLRVTFPQQLADIGINLVFFNTVQYIIYSSSIFRWCVGLIYWNEPPEPL